MYFPSLFRSRVDGADVVLALLHDDRRAVPAGLAAAGQLGLLQLDGRLQPLPPPPLPRRRPGQCSSVRPQ